MQFSRVSFLVLASPVLFFAAGDSAAPPKKETFLNKNCAATESCGLKNFWIITEEYSRPAAADYNRGKFFVIGYETDSVERLEDYGVVLFMRGRVWSSQETPDGVEHSPQYSFPDWTIYSLENDPFYRYMYVPGTPRHYYYRWNTVQESVHYKTAKFYGEEKPSHPRLYVSFSPPTAFVMNGIAQNVSLDVRACIYKIKDIPEVTNDANFASPIHCFERSAQYVYDHAKNTFESKWLLKFDFGSF